LQDKSGRGKADVQERFGETEQSGGKGGTGIGLYKGALYAEINDRIVKYAMEAGSIVRRARQRPWFPSCPRGDHPMHPFLIDAKGAVYVDVASASNACQLKNRNAEIARRRSCVELETAAESGSTTPTRPTRNFPRPIALPREFATAKDLPRIPAAICL